MFRLFVFALLLILTSSLAQATVGFRQFILNPSDTRPLNVALWYPTPASGTPEIVGENPAFYGESVLRNAAPAQGQHPLVMLSHGYGGSWRNLNWLAAALAAQGYIVAAPNHPGTTTENHDALAARQLWLRPQDLNRVMDTLLADAQQAGKVDRARIAAIGHSLGGWTVMALAGAQFSSKAFIHDCQQHQQFSDCKLIETLGISQRDTPSLLDAPQPNPLIKAVVSLDLGLARGFTPASLAKIRIPVMVLSAERDTPELPASLESGYLAQYLSLGDRSFLRIAGATHFSFMQRCKPGAAALIDKFSPGDGIVCSDKGTRDRAAIHQDVIARITQFLAAALDRPADGIRSASAH